MFLYEGFMRFYSIRRRWWMTDLNVILVICGMLGLSYYLYVDDDIAKRIVVANGLLTLFFVRIAFEPLLFAASRKQPMQWLLSISLLPLVAPLAVRTGLYLNLPATLSVRHVVDQDRFLFWGLFYGIFVELVIVYCFLSLTSDRVEAELKHRKAIYQQLNVTLQDRIEEETKLRVAQNRQMEKHSRMAAMGEMISAIAHQWRQPLSTLAMIVQRTYAMGTMEKLNPGHLDEFKSSAMGQIRYMSDTIEEFRGFYRPEKVKVLYSPTICISDSIRLFESQFVGNRIEVQVLCPGCDSLLVNGYPNEFKQVILNLLSNARDAIVTCRASSGTPEIGNICVHVQVNGRSGMIIDVSDNGCGILPETSERIFEPYFTTKEELGGTGIGLYMSRMIIEDSMGGSLNLLADQILTTFRIELAMEQSS